MALFSRKAREPAEPHPPIESLLEAGETIRARTARSVEGQDWSTEVSFAEIVVTDRRIFFRGGRTWAHCPIRELREMKAGLAAGGSFWVIGFIRPDTHRFLTLRFFDLDDGQRIHEALTG